MFAGGKYRDNVKVYADTPFKRDPEEMGKALLGRMDDGFEFLKMDIGLWIAAEYEGGVVNKSLIKTSMNTMHPFTGIQVTDYGIEKMGEFVATVRDTIGYEIPLASDHFGHMNVESAIRIGKALDKYTLAWYEDMIPWQFVDQWSRLKAAVDTPYVAVKTSTLKKDSHRLSKHAPSRWRNPRNKANSRYGTRRWYRNRTAPSRYTCDGDAKRSVRYGDRQLHRSRNALGRQPLVERSCNDRRSRWPNDPERLRECSRRSRTRH
jgi:hypothetical protein